MVPVYIDVLVMIIYHFAMLLQSDVQQSIMFLVSTPSTTNTQSLSSYQERPSVSPSK